MPGPTEKMFRELDAFISCHQDEIRSDADVERLVDLYMSQQSARPGISQALTEQNARTADDFLELADDAEDGETALRPARKALELEPENADALGMQAVLEGGEDENRTLALLREALAQSTAAMERDGWFTDENVGAFWGLVETRPYMRLRFRYMHQLTECGKLRAAACEGEELLRLCENDNMGVRHSLMCLYAELEEREAMLALHKRYEETEESSMLLPLSVGFYKLDDLEAARDYLMRLNQQNPDLRAFIDAVRAEDVEKLLPEDPAFGCRANSAEELMMLSVENPRLFTALETWFDWVAEQLPAPARRKRAKPAARKGGKKK